MIRRLSFAALAAATCLTRPAVMAQEAAEGESHYQGVLRQAMTAWPEPEGRDAPAERQESDALYVLGNVANTMFHEFGHALISELSIPIVGKEEDAVDAFANVVMVAKADDPYLDAMIEAVADDWFISGQFENEQGGEPSPWAEHSMNEQRAGAVICILVGADPEVFKEAADNAGMPEERQQSCKFDYEQAQQGWDQLLSAHYRPEGEGAPEAIPVTFEEAPDELQPIAAFVQASGIVEDIVVSMNDTVVLEPGLNVTVKSCGEENAYWSPDDRQLTLCYEIVQGYYDRVTALE
jgi:hypothetical protein